jgi:hypothetical protein
MKLDNVREYCEEMDVEIIVGHENYRGAGREQILARNEGGYNSTCVDLLDLVAWLKNNRPELLK